MTRKEKEQRLRTEKGQVFEIRDIAITATYLSPNYALAATEAVAVTGTGLLKVFELVPSHDGPSFIGRWDGGTRGVDKQERCDLDIDIYGVSSIDNDHFKKEEFGFSGHRTVKVSTSRGRSYFVSIRTPDELIFEGRVSFTAHRRLLCEGAVFSVGHVGATRPHLPAQTFTSDE